MIPWIVYGLSIYLQWYRFTWYFFGPRLAPKLWQGRLGFLLLCFIRVAIFAVWSVGIWRESGSDVFAVALGIHVAVHWMLYFMYKVQAVRATADYMLSTPGVPLTSPFSEPAEGDHMFERHTASKGREFPLHRWYRVPLAPADGVAEAKRKFLAARKAKAIVEFTVRRYFRYF